MITKEEKVHKTAHEKLLDMHYSYEKHNNVCNYQKGSSHIRIYDDGSFRWLFNGLESPSIFDVIKQYIKELKEKL